MEVLRTVLRLLAHMLGPFRHYHTALQAYVIKKYRTREVLKVYRVAHAAELASTSPVQWPITVARHRAEIQAINAGKLDIVDRKSWQWPFLPASVQRLSVPIIKSTPYNLRRMSRTPVPRRAINLIKNAVIAQPWEIRPLDDVDSIDNEDGQKERIKILTKTLRHPNNQDSFQTYQEQGIEDMCCFGAFASEIRLTTDPDRPIKLWPVNVESIRIFASWNESSPDMPHYAQMTGLKGERGAVLFYDDELMYIRDNPATDNPFGLGKMETGFMAINDFLGVQGMAGRAGSDQVHKTWLWWEQPQADSSYQIVRRHIQNELEGQAKVSIVGGMKKPDVLEINPVTPDDLLLDWQEMLIRMIANAFDMSAMALGIEHDINRAVGQVLDDKDFRSAVVPMARRLMEAFTRRIVHAKLGWYDLEFAYIDLDDPDIETKSQLLARLYSANAMTPNRMLKALRMPELESPFADLTQAEQMLVNIDAQAKAAEEAAQNNFNRQIAMMQIGQSMQTPPDEQSQPAQDEKQPQPRGKAGKQKQLPPGREDQAPGKGGAGGGAPPLGPKVTPATVSKGGQPPSPKPLGLPKFPIAGTIYSAKQIAQMPVNQIADVLNASGTSPLRLWGAMQDQEPGILEQMSDEVRDFFDEAIKREAEEPKKKIPARLFEQWRKDLQKRVRRDGKRTNDFAQWLRTKAFRNASGVPGKGFGPTGYDPKAGKPGNINPIRKG